MLGLGPAACGFGEPGCVTHTPGEQKVRGRVPGHRPAPQHPWDPALLQHSLPRSWARMQGPWGTRIECPRPQTTSGNTLFKTQGKLRTHPSRLGFAFSMGGATPPHSWGCSRGKQGKPPKATWAPSGTARQVHCFGPEVPQNAERKQLPLREEPFPRP